MTAVQMKQLFLVLYDKVTNLAAPGYTDLEISLFFNKAQLQFAKQRYNYKSNKLQEGFEETEKRRKDLSELVQGIDLSSSDLSSDQTSVSPNGSFYDLPIDLLYAIREEITIASTDTCINGNRILVKPVTHDEYAINIHNPFKKPGSTVAWRLDYSSEAADTGKRHEIITGSTYTISTYHLRYLKSPTEISITDGQDCMLSPDIHEEIVDMAVRIATGITDPKHYQIKSNEQNLTE